MDSPYSTFASTYKKLMPAALQDFLTEEDLDRFVERRYRFLQARNSEISIRIQDPEEDLPWLINSTLIEVCLPDSPFITDTILDYLGSEGHRIHLSIPALLTIERKNGKLQDLQPITGNQNTEAYVYVEIQKLSEKEKRTVQKDLHRNLTELRQVVRDFPLALDYLRSLDFEAADLDEDREWIAENFVILGSATFSENRVSRPTGLLRESAIRNQALQDLQQLFKMRPDQKESKSKAPEFLFHESGIMSRVNRHRALHLIVIPSVPQFILAGHFAGRGELTPRFLNPPARRKVERLAEKIYAPGNSHRRKLLFQIAQMIPVGILLSRRQDLIERWLTQILDNLYVEEPDFAVDADPEYGMIWILGIVSGREASAFSPDHVERVARQLHFIPEITIRRRMNEHDLLFLSVRPTDAAAFDTLLTELKHSVHQLFASWQNRFRKSLTNHFIGERLIEQKLAMYRAALSPSAEVHQEPEEALQDLIRLEELDESHPLKAAFHRRKEEVYVKIYSLSPRPIGDLVPVLANFGFRVTDEFTFPGRFPERMRYIYAYRIQDSDLDPRFDTSLARVLEATILGNNSDEPVNRLAVFGLDQYQLSLVKGLQAYLFQIDRTFSRAFIARASLSQRQFIASLIAFLESRFAPGSRDSERLQKEQTLESTTRQLLEQISSVMESLLCNRLLEISNAIVRTNYYQQSPEISFKVHSQAISALPTPVPLFEIFVYSSRFEAVHLRGANIARGGIRWSDRPDDFRTEIHGLMKAQMVKNTVIVPSGSKGGFCLKGDRATEPAFALECYRTFMANLLRLTDNRTPAGKIKRPALTCLDPADPYLVVAADKGTARFSDDANEVAQSMHFWLGDAFASGGRHGYDHKKQGITARGAWQSVRRHFYEMGQDPESDPITVVGIGDMAGDVFGNGMLLSRSMKLVAAFNHKHIFLDPDPSTESWKERKRLFENVLGWDQYKTSLISTGGGVFDRSSARISVSREAAEVLGIAPATMSGEELIRTILCARVDLLWNGGIGTYVKASTESHSDAMDPANDRVRVNGNQLRARVIGEGGNLGWTQKARIEAAAAGVRMNTDAVDNSGGVDMSDHEVNLKILLEKLVRTEQIADAEQRNRWISRLEDRMIELVLENNVAANLCLSLDQKRLKHKSDAFLATLRWLEECGHSLDGISSDELHASDNPARLLSRPVLCSMLGHAKLELKKEMLGADSMNEAELESWLFSYFPEELVAAFKEDVAAHPLRKEIIVTGILNHCVDYGGITFFRTVRQRTGADPARIAKARLAVEHFMRAEGLRDQEHPHAKAELNHLLGIEEQLESMTAMLLRYRKDPMEIFRLGAPEKQRFATILERLEVMQNDAGIRAGAASMDLAFWFFLQSERKQPLPESALGRYLEVLQSPSMQAVDRYLKTPMSSSVAEMRFHRRIRAQRDRVVLQIVLDRIPLDRLSFLADLFDGDDTPRSLAIFEGLEEMSVSPHTGAN